jgi:hypothetical protein
VRTTEVVAFSSSIFKVCFSLIEETEIKEREGVNKSPFQYSISFAYRE